MHQHDCPMCDKEQYECDNYGCEDEHINVCDDCLEDIAEETPQVGNS